MLFGFAILVAFAIAAISGLAGDFSLAIVAAGIGVFVFLVYGAWQQANGGE